MTKTTTRVIGRGKHPNSRNHWKHGWTGTRLHNIWRDMLKRCADARNEKYGGRGIQICDAWFEFVEFRDWALTHGYQEHLTIERADNNKGYAPDNCLWVSVSQQARNRRNTRWIVYRGTKRSLVEWCELLNLNYAKINARLNKLGWTVEQAFEGREVK